MRMQVHNANCSQPNAVSENAVSAVKSITCQWSRDQTMHVLATRCQNFFHNQASQEG